MRIVVGILFAVRQRGPQQYPVYQGDFGMPNVMAHPAVGEELDLEEIVARFEDEGGEEADWGDDEGDDWGEDEDLEDEDDWDDDEWDEDDDEDWDAEDDDWTDDEEEV
jgi:hypothetical protein